MTKGAGIGNDGRPTLALLKTTRVRPVKTNRRQFCIDFWRCNPCKARMIGLCCICDQSEEFHQVARFARGKNQARVLRRLIQAGGRYVHSSELIRMFIPPHSHKKAKYKVYTAVSLMRKRGANIENTPSKGYRLVR